MHIYKELSFCGDKPALDEFKKNAPSFVTGDWEYSRSNRMRDYIAFDYLGNQVNQAEVSIYYGSESWRQGYIVTVLFPCPNHAPFAIYFAVSYNIRGNASLVCKLNVINNPPNL